MDTQSLLRAFQHLYRDGISLSAALQLEDIPRTSYYDFKRNFSGTEAALRVEAQTSVVVEIELERARAVRMREVRQLEIEELLLGGVEPVLKALIDEAREAEGIHVRIAALRELRQWLEGGMLHTALPSAAEETTRLAAPHLPDFLSSGQISEMSVRGAQGDEIILRRGQIIEGVET